MSAFPNPFALLKSWIIHEWADFTGHETIASAETQISRQNQCDLCVHVSEGGWMCNLCGCLLVAKRSMAQERCPMGKWERVWKVKSD